jgi:hypothetical protein
MQVDFLVLGRVRTVRHSMREPEGGKLPLDPTSAAKRRLGWAGPAVMH